MVFQFFLPRRAEVSREGQFCSPRRAEDSREGQFRSPRRAEDFPAILAVRLPVNFWFSDPSSFDVFAGKVTNLFFNYKTIGRKNLAFLLPMWFCALMLPEGSEICLLEAYALEHRLNGRLLVEAVLGGLELVEALLASVGNDVELAVVGTVVGVDFEGDAANFDLVNLVGA